MLDRSKLVAPCGIDCGNCELYLSRHNAQIKEFLVSRGIPEAILPCDGCRNIAGKCPVIQGSCATYACAEAKGVSFCSECDEFPCEKLAPAADKANTLPHNLKIYNLCMIKKLGVEAFTKRSKGIKQAYFKGKMKIGQGP